MTETIWQSIATTPWWVFVVSFYIIYNAFLALKPRLIPIKYLFINGLVYIGLTSFCMCLTMKTVDFHILGAWSALSFLGAGIGYLHYNYRNIKVFPKTKSLSIPGSLFPLIFVSLAMFAKFYYHISLTMTLLTLIAPKDPLVVLSLYAFLTGLYLGRMGYSGAKMQALVTTSA